MKPRGIINIGRFLVNRGMEAGDHIDMHCCFAFLGCQSILKTPALKGCYKKMEAAGWKEITLAYNMEPHPEDPSGGEMTSHCCPSCADKIFDEQLRRIICDGPEAP